ncbi:MAG: NADH:flavin oxidoreductase [Dehalococcoidales bacterium]|nr:MAG: NADH:flavin oxidoreductase [Dehalococcoidales bacterium]
MPGLFDRITVNKTVLDNRFIRSATMDGMANNGLVSDNEIKLYQDLGKGEIGLIYSHGLFPTKEGQCSPGQVSVHTDDAIPSLKKMVDAVHENGGKIAAQILHGGWMCSQQTTGMQPVGPSEIIHPMSKAEIRELTSDEVHELVDDYAHAAWRIQEAGFDGVQLHAAHSWILSAFLSPVTNKRDDEWGGTNEKRTNLLRQIGQGMRKVTRPDYPIMIKLGIKDYHPEGKTIDDGIEQAKLLEEAGYDAIEVSEGLEQDFFHHIRPEATSPYYLEECRQVKQALSIPVMLVGGLRNISDMKAVIEDGIADAISMCRPFIMDPYVVKKIRQGNIKNSECTSCNGCIGRRKNPNLLECVLT